MSFDEYAARGTVQLVPRRTSDAQVSRYDHIATNIQQINSSTNTIARYSSMLGTPKDDPDLRERLSSLISRTKESIRETSTLIRMYGEEEGSDPETKKRRAEQQKLSKDMQKVAKHFQDIVKESAEKERKHQPNSIQPQLGRALITLENASRSSPFLFGDGVTADEREALIQKETEKKKLVTFERELAANEASIQEREEAIRELERTVSEVNEMLRDLAILVKQQQETLDLIDENIAAAETKTKGAVQQLHKASEYQYSCSKKMMCIAAVVAVLVFITVVVVLATM